MDSVSIINQFCQRNPNYMVNYTFVSQDTIDVIDNINNVNMVKHTFVVKCTLSKDGDEVSTLGEGTQKTSAKQSAAKNMIEFKKDLFKEDVDRASYRLIFGSELDPSIQRNVLEDIWNGEDDTFTMAIRKKIGNNRIVKTYTFKLVH
jgi:double-stranded RNA binding protein